MKTFLNNYLSRNPRDREVLREAISKATNNEAVLIFRNNVWEIAKAPKVKITV